MKPLFALFRHAPTVDDTRGLLTSPEAITEVLPLDFEALTRAARLLDSVSANCEREITISTSPTDRGKITASAIAERLERPCELFEDERLLNIDQGIICGRPQSEFSQTPLYYRWHTLPAMTSFPQGESLIQVAARIDDFIAERSAQNRLEVIVSHTTPLQVLATRMIGSDLQSLWQMYFAYY